jgi:hypothetical protein
LKWAYAGAIPALFVAMCLALTPLAAPEHDDYCFAIRTITDGAVPTVVHFYTELTGRITALVLIQLPQMLASGLSLSILSTYSLVLTIFAVLFVAGSSVAIGWAWRVRGARLFLLTSTFCATTIAVAPSPHELLFWLPGAVCYVPPAIVAILFLAAASRLEWITGSQAACLSLTGSIVAMCNEFTAPWLILILLFSVAARHAAGKPRQLTAHAVIAGFVLAGFLVILLAPGNAGRRSELPNSGQIWYSLKDGLVYSISRWGKFITRPAVITCVVAAALLALSCRPIAALDRRAMTWLAASIAMVCGACCYFAFFVHGYSTGGRLVERAENQALILLLFGTMLAASILARAWFSDVTIPEWAGLVLAVAIGASLAFSPTGRLLRTEGGDFLAFHREAVERDQALRKSADAAPFVPRHKATPSLLMGVDADVNSGCLGRYYGKASIRVEALIAR